jgi:hypothetical protein
MELYEVGARFTIQRQHLPLTTPATQEDHWDNKDQVWLKHVNEHIGVIYLNTIEDHCGNEAHHGETVTLTIRVHAISPLERTRKSHLVDHEAIKAKFDVNAADDEAELRVWGPELHRIHETNPFGRFIFGRAQWTYVSRDLVRQIDAIDDERNRNLKPELRDRSWTHVRYPYFEGQPAQYLPPSTDHRQWLSWVEREWDYATDEQRALMLQCLTKMREDGHETPDY